MMLYPEVQMQAQKYIGNRLSSYLERLSTNESFPLDSVVENRIPTWENLADIPIIRCLMKEVWRWRPPVALGHPHTTTRDLEYEGVRIPKGARLHLNAW